MAFWMTPFSITSPNATRCGTQETSGQPRCWIVSEPSSPVRGVYGNVDGAELRADLPEDLVWECEGLNVYMTHIGGYPGNYDRRAGKEVRRLRPGLFICGHSHILKVTRDPALGLLHMNPGACGHNGWHLGPHSAAAYKGIPPANGSITVATLGQPYQTAADPVVRIQVARAGIRLANELKAALP
jgi:Calcineurin-like phosphoesterase superfamily domain